jgi:two-component system LytT family response regulator
MQPKLKTVLIDDESHCLDTLSWQLETYCPAVEVVRSFSNPIEALKYLMYQDADIVFLDIEMPMLNGFELLNALPKKDFALIFTTAYDEFAIKAIKHRALDYLLKPIDRSELQTSVSVAALNRKDLKNKLDALLKDMSLNQLPKVPIHTHEGVILVQPEEIIRCESDSNYTHVYLKNGKKLTLSKTLKEVEEQLANETFFRVHQSHLVNFSHVKQYVKGSNGHLLLDDGSTIPVSRRKKGELLSRID